MERCPVCSLKDSSTSVVLNCTSSNLSNIEILLDKNGELKVRAYAEDGSPGWGLWYTQDVVNFNYCPICGRHLDED